MYKIKRIDAVEETINVTVDYTFKNGSVVTIIVPVFMPENRQDIITAIQNREISEQRKLDATARNIAIVSEMSKEIEGAV